MGLLLFGSFARGEADRKSDLDLLVLHNGRPPDDLLDGLGPRVSLSFHAETRFDELPGRSPLFANHLAREGVILQDSSGALARTLGRVDALAPAAADRLAARTARRCGVVLRDPSFHASDRLSAAELFALSKQAAFLYGARYGNYEFNRKRAFFELAAASPGLAGDVEGVFGLEPIWLASRRTAPFPSEFVPITTDLVKSVGRILRFVAGR